MDPNFEQNLRARRFGTRRLDIDGYLYIKSCDRKDSCYWDCYKVREKMCKARAVTTTDAENRIIIIKGPEGSAHSHPPNREMVEAERIKCALKEKAQNGSNKDLPSVIIQDELAGASGSVLSQLPERKNLQRIIRRERTKNTLPNLRSLAELHKIPESYCKTALNDNFLLYDSGVLDETREDRVIVFATRRNLEVLRDCEVWFADGTFKVTPNIFTQVFTILGSVPKVVGNAAAGTVPLPLVYAFLSSKKEAQYAAVFKAIKMTAEEYNIKGLEPRIMASDFEQAIINAIHDSFPDCIIQLSFFHLKQSLYRQVQSLGLQRAYNDGDDSTVRDFCHMLAGLAYVPVEDVRAAYCALAASAPRLGHIPELLDYFGRTYVIGIPCGAGRRRAVPPTYAPVLWNAYTSICTQSTATSNNASESWHNRFAQMVGRRHPDIYSLISEIKKEQADTELGIIELRMGRKIKAAPKKKWTDIQTRIRTLVQNYPVYGVDQVLQYLRLLSHHITIN